MNYEAWRISFQDSEQAAKAAFQDAQRNHEMLLNTLTRCNELDANLQRIIAAATAEGPGPLTQAAIKEMPAASLTLFLADAFEKAEVESSMKVECIGEFSIEVDHACTSCHENGSDEECEFCEGEGSWEQKHMIEWTMTKDIFKAMCIAKARHLRNSVKLEVIQ
ncbi:hypothetical protein KF947_21155 [Halomonas sp. FeN2]|uniref:hypothetical protein n=1 Tax=Halomonas sp. FeN2 TaxID=2832500 RepID=UPI001D0A3446|nr:hypothetical protein [Halomonas sp. FeN2]UBR49786.1 hypothetical protein KF947_21155 [Halomonas sp. FeN2]